jgi:hypothetical protein
METTMATEALDLPRGTRAIDIRVPRRIRAFFRARRIARVCRERDQVLIELQLHEATALIRLRERKGSGWLEEFALTQLQSGMLIR